MFLFLEENIVVGDVSMTSYWVQALTSFKFQITSHYKIWDYHINITLGSKINKNDAKVTYGKMQLFQTF
jgi:hypothetical protein